MQSVCAMTLKNCNIYDSYDSKNGNLCFDKNQIKKVKFGYLSEEKN